MEKIYLASQSPRRRELLTQIGIEYQVLGAPIIEQRLEGEKPLDYVCRLAAEKSQSGWHSPLRQAHWPVLGADTVVVLNDEVLEKPCDEADGKAMLARLSGQTHLVYTGVAFCLGERVETGFSKTAVTFSPMSEADIDWYWQIAHPIDKAGAYGIQDAAGRFVSNINGSYTGVVGLPLFETTKLLKLICQ